MPPREIPGPLRVGSILLAVSAVGLLAAPMTILRGIPDLTTRPHRHAFAGALALLTIAVLESILALIPIRRGEKWALATAALPFILVGIPMLVVDATTVTADRLWNTLAPQVLGLVVGTSALVLCAFGCLSPRR